MSLRIEMINYKLYSTLVLLFHFFNWKRASLGGEERKHVFLSFVRWTGGSSSDETVMRSGGGEATGARGSVGTKSAGCKRTGSIYSFGKCTCDVPKRYTAWPCPLGKERVVSEESKRRE